MKKRNGSYFLWGFVLSALAFFVIWYWQKSTSADEGALDLLDDLAATKARIRQWQGKTAVSTLPQPSEAAAAAPAEDLTIIHGIGPVYASRLQAAGVKTLAGLAAQTPERISEIVGLKGWQAANPEKWIAEANALVNS